MPRITGQSGNDTEHGGTATKERAPAKAKSAQPRTKAKRNEKAARDYFQGLIDRDLEAMAAFWDEQTVEDIVPVGILRGPDELRQFFGELFTAMPDLETTIDRIVADATTAVVQWRQSGTFRGGPFMGIEPTGKHVEVRGCDVIQIEDGKLRRNTAFFDGAAFARAVGMLPPRESGAERAMYSAFNAMTKVRSRVQQRRGSQ